MATINTTEELLELLRENREFREAVRREVLTESLIRLPREFTSMAERGSSTEKVIREMVDIQNRTVQHLADLQQSQIKVLETQNSTLQQLSDLRQRQTEMSATQNGMLETQNSLLEIQSSMLRRLDNIEVRVERMDGAFGNFRGNYAEAVAIKNAASIAFGLDEVKGIGLDETRVAILTREDVLSLAREYDSEKLAAIDRGRKESLYKADLIIEVAKKEDSSTSYIAVEASYTCDERDTSRAISHADLLKEFTEKEAWPAIAGVRKDNGIQAQIDSGEVFWYQLDDNSLGPDAPN